MRCIVKPLVDRVDREDDAIVCLNGVQLIWRGDG